MKLTRGAIRNRVQMLVSDKAPSGGNWVSGYPTMFPISAYNRFINDALRTVYAAVPWPEVEETQSAVADQAVYTVYDVSQIELVEYDGSPLEVRSAALLDELDETWRSATSTKPLFYVLNDTNDWANISGVYQRQFRLYPAPSGTDTIRVIGRWYPTDLYSDWCVPALPSWMQEAITFEAAAMILEAPTEHRNSELSSAYRQLAQFYMTRADEIRGDRYPKRLTVRGQSAVAQTNILRRDPHIPYTGTAPGTAE